ncbi:dihydrolipoyllysine-residue succinyltransferase [Pseudidiomarina aestuarii]|uniref:Dihydrolipoyllysine-residue succinyltransferase component of 2-oxoglutarate dehydrogenase complex n=1 Tax=Pseudidiomarina aestuarii TaxID=624146 RepID=A0A2T4D7T3_9GAMM|nr:dihydrolipoyllysine-residue succinyltransferase [Pseudidiomarina aestuarii]PTB89812.1 dihydrolipoyllysine-residue succinyltransferase [Pseudidiomarina aestuarii]
MAIDIKVPQLPESVADATVATWHVKPGDKVSRDQNLVDIETDKVVLEVVAPEDGVIGEIIAEEGATVGAEEVIGKLEKGDGAAAKSDSKQDSKADAKEEPKEESKDESKDEKAPKPAAKSSGSGEKLEVKVPTLPESVADATIATWHVKAGDAVKRDQNLVDIETDKVVLEVVAPADGVLAEIKHEEGATVGADDVIGIVEAGGSADAQSNQSDDKAAEPESSSDDDSDSDVAGPAVRRLLAEHNLKAADIKGTGKGGRVTKEDVEKHMKDGGKKEAPAAQPAAAPAKAGDRDQKRVPMTRLRKTIAKRLLEAKNATAMLTTFNEVNMKPIMDLRKKYKDVFEERHDTRLGFMGFYVKAVTEALKRFPDVNASIDGDDIVYHNYFDISIAVSTPRGLVTPVLRDTDKMSIADIENGIRDLALKGRDGKLTMDDMQGGNFTITNGGVFGSLLSTPILNPPQSAILGMHKIQDRPMAVDGKVEILPMMYLALSYDHRIIDGKESVGFLVTIKELLEDPQRLLLDV